MDATNVTPPDVPVQVEHVPADATAEALAAFFAEAEALCKKYKQEFANGNPIAQIKTKLNKVRRKKDATRTKRAATPYIAFVTEQRDTVQLKMVKMMTERAKYPKTVKADVKKKKRGQEDKLKDLEMELGTPAAFNVEFKPDMPF